MVEPLLPKRWTGAKKNMTPLDEVLIALQFYATVTFQSVVGNVLKVNRSSVCHSIHDVSYALSKVAHEYISYDTNLTQA